MQVIANGRTNYPHDLRLYEPLPVVHWANILDGNDHRDAMMRLMLWFAVRFNLVFLFWNKTQFSATTVTFQSRDQAFHNAPAHVELSMRHISLLAGGFGRRLIPDQPQGQGQGQLYEYIPQGSEGDLVHQPCHGDYMPIIVNGQEVTVANNPNLVGKFKPGSFIIPLDTPRRVYFGTVDNMLSTSRGEFFYFSALNNHGGESTIINLDDIDWGFAIHGHIDSVHHPHVADQLNLAISPATYMPPEHVGYLSTASLIEVTQQHIFNFLPFILRQGRALVLQGGDTTVINSFRGIVADFLRRSQTAFRENFLQQLSNAANSPPNRRNRPSRAGARPEQGDN
jgi:hypothetical protein